jgi:dTDP-4-amino-4,6-dideoxygalactose transaminase
MAKLPLVDLKAQYAGIKAEIDAAMAEVLNQTAFIGGQKLKDFEAAFAAYCGVKYAIGVGNGTDALAVALKALGVGPGDEVISVSHSFIATTEAVTQVGARLRFVDIDPRTYTLDPQKLAAAITPATKAIIPVHLYGQIANMPAILEVARAHGLRVLEDSAQAHGARLEGRRAGAWGDMACFSFYPGKNLGAYGDGGAIVTDDEALAKYARMYANHGRLSKYEHEFEGVNSRLDGLQAAILNVKLAHLDTWNAQRRQAAEWYAELLSPLGEQVLLPYVPPGHEPVYHLYVIQVAERDSLLDKLKAADIEGGIHYPVPLHEQPAYRYMGHGPEDFPHTHLAAKRIVSLPLFPEITLQQCEQVAAVVKAHVASLR